MGPICHWHIKEIVGPTCPFSLSPPSSFSPAEGGEGLSGGGRRWRRAAEVRAWRGGLRAAETREWRGQALEWGRWRRPGIVLVWINSNRLPESGKFRHGTPRADQKIPTQLSTRISPPTQPDRASPPIRVRRLTAGSGASPRRRRDGYGGEGTNASGPCTWLRFAAT